MTGTVNPVDAQSRWLRMPLHLLHIAVAELEQSQVEDLDPEILGTLACLADRLRELSSGGGQVCETPETWPSLSHDPPPGSKSVATMILGSESNGSSNAASKATKVKGNAAATDSETNTSTSAPSAIEQGPEADVSARQPFTIRPMMLRRQENQSKQPLDMLGIDQRCAISRAPKGNAMLSDMHIGTDLTRPRFMLSQHSPVRILWDFMFSFVLFTMTITEPLFVAFAQDQSALLPEEITSGIDLVFCVDILLNFRTGFYTDCGLEVMDPWQVAKHYAATWLALDLVSSLPVDVLLQNHFENFQVLRLLKIGKIAARLYRCFSTSRLILGAMSTEAIVDWYDSVRGTRLFRLLPLCEVLLMTLLCCHWLGCFLIISGDNVVDEFQDVDPSNKFEIYVLAFYWAVATVSSVGYGDIVPVSTGQRLYSIVAMILGGAFYGYVIARLTSIVTRTELAEQVYEQRMDDVETWLDFHRLPAELRKNTRRYFKQYFVKVPHVDNASMLNCLSPELFSDISECLLEEGVKTAPIFADLPHGVMRQLVKVLQTRIVQADEHIVQKGEIGYGMYIITDGAVLLELDDVKMPHIDECSSISAEPACYRSSEPGATKRGAVVLEVGDSFGDELLLKPGGLYPYSAVAQTRSNLSLLTTDAFKAEFGGFPKVLEQVSLNAASLRKPYQQRGSQPPQQSAQCLQRSKWAARVSSALEDERLEEARPLLESSER